MSQCRKVAIVFDKNIPNKFLVKIKKNLKKNIKCLFFYIKIFGENKKS